LSLSLFFMGLALASAPLRHGVRRGAETYQSNRGGTGDQEHTPDTEHRAVHAIGSGHTLRCRHLRQNSPRKNLKQGNKAAAFRNMQILDVRSDNPQVLPRLRQQFDNHFLVDGFVEEKLHVVKIRISSNTYSPSLPAGRSAQKFVADVMVVGFTPPERALPPGLRARSDSGPPRPWAHKRRVADGCCSGRDRDRRRW